MAMDRVDSATTIRNMYYDDTEVTDGIRYTTKEDPNELSNDDFLTLLLEEMKMQDPTEPMDSQRMMDSQLQMSTIKANTNMADAMASLQTAFSNSVLSTAANLIGNIVENGEYGDDGLVKSYKVETVENIDGEMYVNTKQLTGLIDNLVSVVDGTATSLNYDTNGYIYEDGSITDIRIKLTSDGRFDFDENTNIQLINDNDEIITDSEIIDKYQYNGSSIQYSEDITTIAMTSIDKIR